MKLSKNKIKQLLKVKNQSQKRLHKNNNNKKNNKQVRTMRMKKHTDLRHKTLRRRLKRGGGNVQASSKKVLEGINDVDKATMLEEKKKLDDLLSKNYNDYVSTLDTIVNYFDKFTSNYIEKLKQISNQTSGHDEETDRKFIQSLVSKDIIQSIYKLNTSFTQILVNLSDIVKLLSDFITNKPNDETLAQSDVLNYITNILNFVNDEYQKEIKTMSELPNLLLKANTQDDNVNISNYLLQLRQDPKLKQKHEEFKALIEGYLKTSLSVDEEEEGKGEEEAGAGAGAGLSELNEKLANILTNYDQNLEEQIKTTKENINEIKQKIEL